MASCKLGTTIIDELRLCYVAEPSILDNLSSAALGERIDFTDFSMVRIVGQHFRYLFKVFVDKKQVGNFYYGQYGTDDSCYVWFKFENHVLYDGELFRATLGIPYKLKLTFNNIGTVVKRIKLYNELIANVI